jgi:hypothetical protein
VPPNGFVKRPRSSVTDTNDNPAGLAAQANELETTPEHYNLVAGDPTVVGWTRQYDDANVVALRARLDRENGIPDLELVEPADIARAVELFDRDGFGVVRDALNSALLERMRGAVDRVVAPVACPTAIRSGPAQRRVTCCTFPSGASWSTWRQRHRSSLQSSARRTISSAAVGATWRFQGQSNTRDCTPTTFGRSCPIDQDESRFGTSRCRW